MVRLIAISTIAFAWFMQPVIAKAQPYTSQMYSRPYHIPLERFPKQHHHHPCPNCGHCSGAMPTCVPQQTGHKTEFQYYAPSKTFCVKEWSGSCWHSMSSFVHKLCAWRDFPTDEPCQPNFTCSTWTHRVLYKKKITSSTPIWGCKTCNPANVMPTPACLPQAPTATGPMPGVLGLPRELKQ